MRLLQYNKTPAEITNFAIMLENAYKLGYCTDSLLRIYFVSLVVF